MVAAQWCAAVLQDRRVELKPELVEALCLGLAQPLLRLQLVAEGGAGVAGVRGTAVGLTASADAMRELANATAGAFRELEDCSPLSALQIVWPSGSASVLAALASSGHIGSSALDKLQTCCG